MGIDKKEIKDALDKFEDDDFVSSKEILQREIKKAKNEYLKTKLNLTKDIEKLSDTDDKEEKETEKEEDDKKTEEPDDKEGSEDKEE
jgi:hypothetical protein